MTFELDTLIAIAFFAPVAFFAILNIVTFRMHLYTAAVHKYLALRLPGYDYERHFGGVIYLFLRGLDPAHPERGTYRDRPSRSAVEQISALLEGK